MKRHAYTTALVTSLCISNASAALIDRGGGLIYDSDLNITWLQDANYARTSNYDTDGLMAWSQANTWANNFSYYDSVRNVTYTDWRLPSTYIPDSTCSTSSQSYGTGCRLSDMGHLFYTELSGQGGASNSSITMAQDPDFQLFHNLQFYPYWSNAYGSIDGWYFSFYNGDQNHSSQSSNYFYAWAVRDGDVASQSVVPVPAATYLFGSGLLALLGVARKKAI